MKIALVFLWCIYTRQILLTLEENNCEIFRLPCSECLLVWLRRPQPEGSRGHTMYPIDCRYRTRIGHHQQHCNTTHENYIWWKALVSGYHLKGLGWKKSLNSLAPGIWGCNFEWVIFKLIHRMNDPSQACVERSESDCSLQVRGPVTQCFIFKLHHFNNDRNTPQWWGKTYLQFSWHWNSWHAEIYMSMG